MAIYQTRGNPKREQAKELADTADAKTIEAARQAKNVQDAADPTKQRGSNVLSTSSPISTLATDRPNFAGADQRAPRGVSQPGSAQSSAPINVYANVPPVGNQYDARIAGAYAASPAQYVDPRNQSAEGKAIRARNAHREEMIARGTPQSARDQAIMQGRTPAAEPNYDALFMTPAEIAERDYNKRDQENYRIEQQYGTKELQARPTPEPLLAPNAKPNFSTAFSVDPFAKNYSPTKAALGEKTGKFSLVGIDVNTGINTPHNAPGSAIPKPPEPFKPYQYSAKPTEENQNWRQDLVKTYPKIGIAGSPENAAFVKAFKLHGDPNLAMETANRLAGKYKEPHEEDIMDLISNPDLANDFDQVYGPGSASKYLPIKK